MTASSRFFLLLKITFRCLLALVTLSLLIALSGWFYFNSASGKRFVSDEINRYFPDLLLEQLDYSIDGEVRLKKLQFSHATTQLLIEEIDAQWQPACLLYRTICIQQINARQLVIENTSQENSNTRLEGVSLPFNLHVSQMNINRASVSSNGETRSIESLQVSGNLNSNTLQLKKFHAIVEAYTLKTNGSVQLDTGHFAIKLLEVNHAGQNLALSARLTGNVEKIRFEGETKAPYPLLFSGEILSPLETPAFKLQLASTRAFRPDKENTSHEIHHIEMNINGEPGIYSGTLATHFSLEKLQDNQLSSRFQWNTPSQVLELESIKLETVHGSLQGDARVVLKEEQISAQGKLKLRHQLSVNGLDEYIETLFLLSARKPLEQVSLTLQQLQGQFNQQAFNGDFGLMIDMPQSQHADQSLQISLEEGRITQGINHLDLAGKWAETLSVNVVAKIPELQRLYPEIAGGLDGTLTLQGKPEKFLVSGTLQLTDIEAGPLKAKRASLKLDQLNTNADNGKLQAQIQQVQYRNTRLKTLDMDFEQQQLSLHGSGTEAGQSFASQCRLDIFASSKALQCGKVIFSWPQPQSLAVKQETPNHWTLEPLHLRYNDSTGDLNISNFCIHSSAGTACQTAELLFSKNQLEGIELDITSLDLQRLLMDIRPQIPDNQAVISAKVTGHWHLSDGPDLKSTFRLKPRIEILKSTATKPRFYEQDIHGNLDLKHDVAHLSLASESVEYGSLRADISLHNPSRENRLSGAISLDGIDLGLLPLFIAEVEKISGKAKLKLQLDGFLASPDLKGEADILAETLQIRGLDFPVNHTAITLDFDGPHIRLNGSSQMLQGTASFHGEAVIDKKEWELQLYSSGKNLKYTPFPRSEIVLNPELKLFATSASWSLKGRVDIPRGTLRLKSRIARAVYPSDDVIIMDIDQSSKGYPGTLDLDVSLGKDVFFESFGAECFLEGAVHYQQRFGNTAKANGEIYLHKGLFRAYGQNLAIRQGRLIFHGALENPDILIEAIRNETTNTSSAVEAGIRAYGTASAPELVLFSNPLMPEADILYYLTTGNLPEKTSGNIDSQAMATSAAISAGLSQTRFLTDKLSDQLGLYDLQLNAAQSEQGTGYSVTGWINRDLSIRLGKDAQRNDEFALRYRIGKQFFIETLGGANSAIDFIYSFEKP